MRVAEARAGATGRLAAAGAQEPAIEAEVLVREAMGADRVQYLTSLREALPLDSEAMLDGLLRRRETGEPLAYILGRREFYGLDFAVGPDVLVPRQETELLVDLVLQHAATMSAPPVVADVGTGSGAVAVAVAVNLPGATVFATDVSDAALAMAEANASRHGVSSRVKLLRGDLLEPVPSAVSIVVSNPPYLSSATIGELQAEVQREPRAALDGGRDGLSLISRLIRQAPTRLKEGGALLVEIDPPQADAVTTMARSAFPGATVSIARDLLGRSRAVSVVLRSPPPEARLSLQARRRPGQTGRLS